MLTHLEQLKADLKKFRKIFAIKKPLGNFQPGFFVKIWEMTIRSRRMKKISVSCTSEYRIIIRKSADKLTPLFAVKNLFRKFPQKTDQVRPFPSIVRTRVLVAGSEKNRNAISPLSVIR